MAFTLPTFNLLCNIYTGPWVTKVLRIANQPCNLALGRRISALPVEIGPDTSAGLTPTLLLPALVDIRDLGCASGYDLVEVPQGTGRWYFVMVVDDIGKGFANEHRYAQLQKAVDRNSTVDFPGAVWPTPIP